MSEALNAGAYWVVRACVCRYLAGPHGCVAPLWEAQVVEQSAGDQTQGLIKHHTMVDNGIRGFVGCQCEGELLNHPMEIVTHIRGLIELLHHTKG